ncbi:DUF2079 domain-containing protein [Amycolatopsis sp. 195334CR]|uniref:DUF2079 domain-containing protein n=1 Tax=Amycolatopsis sp. 195334CR TaxID=2814588 RepID=UPI0027DE806E|nr:DUF2079 domain-containing protein [Amycolatopsis sp. 195334CR]
MALGLLALAPIALAAVQALRASRGHFLLDYWHVLAKTTSDDGTLSFGALFSYHLDQPFAMPSVLFWLDAKVLGGDNRALTVLTVLLLCATVLMLRAMVPASVGRVKRTSLTLLFAFLLLSSHLGELWLQGTNGVSWVPALSLSVLALLFVHRGRFWSACVAAVLACACFGVAFPVWPALALVCWLAGERTWRVVGLLVAGVVVLGSWWVTKPAGPQSLATTALDPDGRLAVVGAALGSLWTVDVAEIAVIAGGAAGAVALLAIGTSIRRRAGGSAESTRPDAGWIGLLAYSLGLALLLALGRTTSAVPGGNVALISRYAIVTALCTSAVAAILVLRRPAWPARYVAVGAVAVALATHAIGGGKLAAAERNYAPLEVVAVALRVNAVEALTALQIQPDVVPAARALGAYPFTDEFTLGCGSYELGSSIDLGGVPAQASQGVVDTPVTGGALLSGWASIQGAAAECVLVVDATGTVRGGGVVGLPRPDVQAPGVAGGPVGWRAVAEPGAAALQVLVRRDGSFYSLPTS